MCDKYILYIYVCLRWGKVHLTDDERSHLFGGRSEISTQLDPKWLRRFTRRCRALYREKLERCPLPSSPVGISNTEYAGPLGESALRTVVVEGTFAMVDSKGRVVRLENFADQSLPRKLSAGDSAFAFFEDTLSVFADAAFRIRGGGGGGGGLGCIEGEPRAQLSLVICRRSGSRDSSAGLRFNWQTCYTVKECDIRGLKVEPGYIYTTDGASLYNLVASWKTDICLIFDEGCREETVRILCALAMGDCKLGIEFKVKCVLPDRVKGLDLRDLDPLEPRLTLREIRGRAPGESELPLSNCRSYHRERGDDVDGEEEGLLSLRDMSRLPSGFSVLTENETVIVLRHILRDAVVIIPKVSAGITNKLRGVAQLKDSESAAPNAYLTEWFPCGHSLLRVERGLPGVPQVLASYNLSPDAEEDGADANGRCKERKNGAGDVPTLHVLRSSKYHKVLASGFRSSGHLFNQSVCLLPQTMDIVAPRTLRFPGCVAIMYAFDIFMQLSVKDSRRASSPVQISFTSMLSLREAQALLLAYMCLTESFVASEDSCFRFVVGSHSALAKLRKFVSANPKACSGLAGLRLSGKEEVMWEELEDEILHTGEEPTRAVCEESEEEEEEEEEEEDDESEEDESEEDESEEDTDDDEEEESEGKDTDDEESEEDASPEESVREAVERGTRADGESRS
ncbi:hypothetical protein D9C73_027772 [Collichthys lucidus]|uniref:Uncharacterized protein n=1 Tax=Collichthys lucidus TaxID=240159 RepID=A0A4U5TUF9_COLLU|nr:hypothetical protein D9C73_027772 [Collichthys lucidus]